VQPDQGDPGLSVNPIQIPVDHIEIAKPGNRESEIYKTICKFIERHSERPVSIEETKIDTARTTRRPSAKVSNISNQVLPMKS